MSHSSTYPRVGCDSTISRSSAVSWRRLGEDAGRNESFAEIVQNRGRGDLAKFVVVVNAQLLSQHYAVAGDVRYMRKRIEVVPGHAEQLAGQHVAVAEQSFTKSSPTFSASA